MATPLADQRSPQTPIVVVFTPGRSRIRGVSFGATKLESVKGHFGLVWHGKTLAGEHTQKPRMQFKGEEPSVLKIWHGNAAPDPLDPKQVAKYVDHAIKDLLNQRGKLVQKVAHRHDRSFFFRYDAWSQSILARALANPQIKESLSKEAKRLFYADMQGVSDPPFEAYESTSKDLTTIFKCRAHDYHAGNRAVDFLSYLPDRNAFLGNIAVIAKFQERLFESSFPGCMDPKSTAFTDLRDAFVRFALGELHVDVPANSKYPAGVSALNAEPDSFMFFAFAELAICASRVRSQKREFWFALARTFAGLVEPYTRVYGDPRYRAPLLYAPANRNLDGVCKDDVEARLEMLAERMPDASMLESQLEPFFAAALLAAMYDEVSWPFSTGKRLQVTANGTIGARTSKAKPRRSPRSRSRSVVLTPQQAPALRATRATSKGKHRRKATGRARRSKLPQ
jgi:hypothetical protein